MPATLLALAATIILVIGAVMWQRRLLMLLPFLAILNGLPIPVGGSSFRIDQVAACLLSVALIAGMLSGHRRLRLDATSRWLVAILTLNVVASIVNSPAPSYSLLQCANLGSAWIIYVILINVLETREEMDGFLRACLWAAAVASCAGIVAFGFAMVGFPIGGADVSTSAAEQLTAAYGAKGTMIEPNIFGSFTGAYLALCVALLAGTRQATPAAMSSRFLRWTAVLTGTGLLLSFTRSAWIGAAVGVALALLVERRALANQRRRLIKPLGIGSGVLLLLLVLPTGLGGFLRFKLANLVNPESRTAVLRILMYTMALQQSSERPFIGWGTFTFAPLVAQGTDFAQFEGWRNLWIGNYLVLAFHDTGVVGLALWLGLLWSIIASGMRAVPRLEGTDSDAAVRVVGLVSAVTSLLIAFLATTGFSIGFPWLLIGLLGAYVRLSTSAPETVTISTAAIPPMTPSAGVT